MRIETLERYGFRIFLSFLILFYDHGRTKSHVLRARSQSTATERTAGRGNVAVGVSYLRKYHDLPKIPKIPEANAKKRVSSLQLTSSNFDPCKVTQLCQNGGKCVSLDGAYYCQCSSQFYGKTCEFLADASKCSNNLCKNDATCYSVKERHPIMITSSDITNNNQGFARINKTDVIHVQYECWCKPGFTGSLCEYSDDMRHCEEDYCLHKGFGIFENSSDSSHCKCLCEENYGGERCQIVLPCMEFKCENGGVCENIKVNGTGDDERYIAKCRCPPPTIYAPLASFKGDHCELIDVKYNWAVESDCFPCNLNAVEFSTKCLHHDDQRKELERMQMVTQVCDEQCRQSKKYCQNGGQCIPEGVIIDAETNRSTILPICHCQGLDEGLLCERAVRSPCDKTSFDPRGPDEKCGQHGNCVAKTAFDYICDCNAGWTGDKCEVNDPCYNHKCSPGSLCVALPIEHREKYSLGYTCICAMNQEADFETSDDEVVKCTSADFGLCTNHECKNDGKCYPCDETDLKGLQLCTDEERNRGFRCVCPYGLLPPFCDKETTVCTNHKCMNGAQCAVDPHNEFNYICNCLIGYTGEFCEAQVSPCVVKGTKTCVMGTCVEDQNYIRGFSCECLDGYEGLNCDLVVRPDLIGSITRNFWWTYPLIAMTILSPIIMMFTVGTENSAKRVYELQKAEKERIEKLKNEKNENDSNNVDTSVEAQRLKPAVLHVPIQMPTLQKETAV